MTLPPFLILEIRTAFQCARRPPVASFVNRYGTTTRLFAPAPPKPRSNAIPSPRRPEHGEGAIKRTSNENTQDSDDQPKELIPRERTRGALDSGRNVLIPTKVLPKADIAPNLKLSPMQRLHIEHLTRHPPPKKPQKRASPLSQTPPVECPSPTPSNPPSQFLPIPLTPGLPSLQRHPPHLQRRHPDHRHHDLHAHHRPLRRRLHHRRLGPRLLLLRHPSPLHRPNLGPILRTHLLHQPHDPPHDHRDIPQTSSFGTRIPTDRHGVRAEPAE